MKIKKIKSLSIHLMQHTQIFRIILWLFSGFEAICINMYCMSLKEKGIKNSDLLWLILLGITGLIHFGTTRWRRSFLKENKEKIIESLLESCSELLFKNCNKEEWSICAMIQMRCGHIRKTPYYVNADWNAAVDQSFDLEFGDVGQTFFVENPKTKFLSRRLSYKDYIESDEKYKEQVPETLRVIIAQAIFSKIDAGKVIGVLEFDVLTRKNANEFPVNIYKSIIDVSNQNSLGKWTKSISFLLEGI